MRRNRNGPVGPGIARFRSRQKRKLTFVRGVTRTPANATDYAAKLGISLSPDYFDTLSDADVVLALGHNRRFLPPLLEMKRRIERGDIGKVIHADANFSDNPSLRHGNGH